MWIHRVELTWSRLRVQRILIIFEILPTDKEWKSNDYVTYCIPWTSCGFHDRGITLQAEFLSTSTALELKLFNCFVLPNKIRIFQSFLQSQSFRSLKLLFANFSSDVVSRRCPSDVSSSPLFVRYSIVCFNNSIVNVGMKFAR